MVNKKYQIVIDIIPIHIKGIFNFNSKMMKRNKARKIRCSGAALKCFAAKAPLRLPTGPVIADMTASMPDISDWMSEMMLFERRAWKISKSEAQTFVNFFLRNGNSLAKGERV